MTFINKLNNFLKTFIKSNKRKVPLEKVFIKDISKPPLPAPLYSVKDRIKQLKLESYLSHGQLISIGKDMKYQYVGLHGKVPQKKSEYLYPPSGYPLIIMVYSYEVKDFFILDQIIALYLHKKAA